MKKWKKSLKRVLAVALAGVMVVSIPELSAITAWGANESEQTLEKQLDSNENVEENSLVADTTKEEPNSQEESVIIQEEIVDLGTIETSGYAISLFGTESNSVTLKDGNYEKWIDRIDVPEYAIKFYDTLVEGSDNDGTDDVLMNGSEKIEVVTLEFSEDPSTSGEADKIFAIMRAVYDAFDRDHPEVFWLSGESRASYGGTIKNDTYYITFNFVLKETGYDVRADEYRDISAIQEDIAKRENAVETIVDGAGTTDTVELIEYFNDWLTKNNEYNTIVSGGKTTDVSRDCWECISALTGKTGINGPVCEGYARAFKVLCDEVNIPCVLVDGFAKNNASSSGEAHMWNYVQVDGKWYAVDVTWNDPVVSGVSGAVSNYECEDWLLLGADTEVKTNFTFIQSHPERNSASINGVEFTNGPTLSNTKYAGSLIQKITVENDVVSYMYLEMPSIYVTLASGEYGTITYQWYKKGDIDTEVANANMNYLPYGLGVGTYYCKVTYGTETKNSPEVTVEKAELEVHFNGNGYKKVYDGATTINASEEELSLRYLSNTVAVDDITATVVYEFADPNVKWYEGNPISQTIRATITLTGDSAQNYKLKNDTIENDFIGMILPIKLTDKEVEITLENDGKLIYNGENQTMNVVSVKTDGQEIATDAYIVQDNKKEPVGDHKLVITFLNGNYSGTVTKEFSIEYLPFDLKNLTYNGSSDLKEWYNDNVVIQAEGYTVLQDDGTYQETYTIENEGINDRNLSFKNEDGYITDVIELPSVKIDKELPIAQISTKTNTWYELLNEITFGIFFKETQEVTIHADDTLSGVLECYYYIDKSGSTTVKTVEELDALTFTKGNTFNIENDDKYVIYAYATDNAGNKSFYVCSDGMVMDTIVPEISEIIEPDVANETLTDTSAIIHFTGSEIGTYSYEVFDNMGQLIGSGEEALKADNSNTFILENLSANTTYEVQLTVTDEAGNVSEVKTISFTTQKTLPIFMTWEPVTGTYGQTIAQMIADFPKESDNGVTGTWSSPSASEIPVAGDTMEYKVTFTPEDTDTYGVYTMTIRPNVAKKQITATITDATKVFGKENPTFDFTLPNDALVGNDSKSDLNITLSTEAVTDSEVGTYKITGSSKDAANYNVTITNGTLTITQADALVVAPIEESYIYTLGSEEKSVSVDIAKLLPTDRGTTTYTCTSTENIISDAKIDTNGVLTYKVAAGNVNETASITITAQSNNYKDITVVVNVTLIDKTPIDLKEGSTVEIADGKTATYGDTLSVLSLTGAVFETNDGEEVAGTLAWANPDTVLETGTQSVEWVFTPTESDKYIQVNGSISIIVAKAKAPTIDSISKNYIYTVGSDGNEVSVDITGQLPTDRGTTTYTCTSKGEILADVSVNENGVVTYKVNAGTLEDAASITVTVTSKNYEDITVIINIGMTDKTPVELKDGQEVTIADGKTLTYGEMLNVLSLSEAIFETEDGTQVNGTLVWTNPNAVLNAGTQNAAWKFIPTESNRYAEATGTVDVTITKATPIVSEVPTAESIAYNPQGSLANVKLGEANGSWVVGEDKVEVKGTWAWQKTTIVPTIGNTGYTAVFTPTDTVNYESVEKTVVVEVTKATPFVSEVPTASTIIYGNTLADSKLTGGKVVYAQGSDIAVSGTFAWETTNFAPTVADSNKTTYKVTFTPENADLYETVTTEVTVTVEKKAITVTANNTTKTFGEENPTFDFEVPEDILIGTDSKSDLNVTLSTNATKTSDVGTYDITGSADAANYDVTITKGTLIVTKAKAPTIAPMDKNYIYTVGSEEEAVSVDITSQLPTDRGTTTYICTLKGDILSNVAVDKNGIVTYKVNAGEINDSANITVTAKSNNYEDITVELQVTLTDKTPIALKEGTTVEIADDKTLVYGDKLSTLSFKKAVFETKDGKEVAGTLAWAKSNVVLEAGTQSVEWVFTPTESDKYIGTNGNVIVTVSKATPNVTAPTTEAITYNPAVILEDVILNGTNGDWIVGGKETEVSGTWTWKDTTIVPTVGNSGYTALFTPTDTTNYNSVEKTVALEVKKATPVVNEVPTASAIIYGATLADSKLTGGKVVYAEGSDIVVAGTFAWKDISIAPKVADSNATEYEIVFTPTDSQNYNTVTYKITLTVEKQEWPSNTPEAKAEVDYDTANVSDIELPEGWEWTKEAISTELKLGEEITVIAQYVAEDKGNFKNTAVEIKVTRQAKAPHIEGDESIMGWDAIEEKIKDTPNAEIQVDMNGFTEVDTNVLEQLQETPDATLVLVFDNGLTWTIKGSDIEDKEFDNYIDMGAELLEKEDAEKPNIPQNLIDSIAKSKEYKFLSLKHNGKFGFKAVLTLKLGEENAGKTVTIYYYDEANGKMAEPVSYIAEAGGIVRFGFTHASDYVITIEETEEEPSNPEEPSNSETPNTSDEQPSGDKTSPDTGYFNIILYLAGILAVISIFSIALLKKIRK